MLERTRIEVAADATLAYEQLAAAVDAALGNRKEQAADIAELPWKVVLHAVGECAEEGEVYSTHPAAEAAEVARRRLEAEWRPLQRSAERTRWSWSVVDSCPPPAKGPAGRMVVRVAPRDRGTVYRRYPDGPGVIHVERVEDGGYAEPLAQRWRVPPFSDDGLHPYAACLLQDACELAYAVPQPQVGPLLDAAPDFAARVLPRAGEWVISLAEVRAWLERRGLIRLVPSL